MDGGHGHSGMPDEEASRRAARTRFVGLDPSKHVKSDLRRSRSGDSTACAPLRRCIRRTRVQDGSATAT
jgi:hypothetical protein